MPDNGMNIISYKRDINRTLGKRNDGKLLDYAEAERMVAQYISDKKLEALKLEDEKKQTTTISIENKTKEDLREELTATRELVTECLLSENISVRNYRDDKIKDFIDDMVHEYGGYSILSDAFYDDEVSDIFVIDWETIFVEKNDKNVPYWKKFRSPDHYKRVLERFLRINGKEINRGENKIVDFELYQDRGCATHSVVSPRDFSVTMRKHKEDHITLDNVLESQVMSEELKDLFGLIIDGECNLIYGGITGSGKTTTIRALIDYYVTRNEKRMLVCEDTQELFPTNKHTLELVSVKGEDVTSIPLDSLIITALRLKPKYIIVGEIRGKEATAAVEGMETGHSTMFTMHGGTVMNIVNRLVTKYLMAMPELGIDVVERIIGSAVDYVAIQDHIPNIGRKVSILSEIDFDFTTRRISTTTICEFDFEINDFVFKNRIGPDKAHKMMRRGVPIEVVRPWIRTEDEEENKKWVKELNEKYYKEKPERVIMYANRVAERKAAKEEAKNLKSTIKTNDDIMTQKVIMNELQKKQEEMELINKANAMENEE